VQVVDKRYGFSAVPFPAVLKRLFRLALPVCAEWPAGVGESRRTALCRPTSATSVDGEASAV